MKPNPMHLCILAFSFVFAFPLNGAMSAENKRMPVILDTDIGPAIDDTFALGLVLSSPELELRGVTTVCSGAEDRARMVCRFLTYTENQTIPVAWGRDPQPKSEIHDQMQYKHHPAVLFGRTAKPVETPAVEFLYEKLKAEPGEITLLAIGPLTNIARLIDEHPDAKPWIKRIVLMGGAVRVGYDGTPPAIAEWNIRSDVKAAQTVFSSGIPLLVAPLDATTHAKLDADSRKRIFAACTPITFQIQTLYELGDEPSPTMFDPVAVALAFDESFCRIEPMRLEVDDNGLTRKIEGEPNAWVATSIREDKFTEWMTNRLALFGEQTLPKPPGNLTTLVERGGLPNRVHVFEDYETDIERRWWLVGRLETNNVPPGSQRACRGVLTTDFDGQMGDTRTMYRAVIFNPVPGPPMGKNTRLTFRYWLKGTGTLRVQLYSLSNGYHRYLSLRDLPQGEWHTATVDMTAMRRPDGSGGALAEDERIDDIQFYTDPRAELFIDDIILYDAAPPEEKRPFPTRIIFTGWFDTGQHGKEWPGDFEIINHEPPLSWKAAKSVIDEKTGKPWIRVSLRGNRPLTSDQLVSNATDCTAIVRTRFKYHLNREGPLRVILGGEASDIEASIENPTVGKWTEAFLDFEIPLDVKHRPRFANEIRFYAPGDGEMMLDDLLIYSITANTRKSELPTNRDRGRSP